MKRNSLLILSLLFMAGSFIASCEKEGPAGPAGAQGPQGTPGSAGAPGPTGPAGPAGTANVIYSNWLDVVFAEDTATGAWFGQIVAPKLDSAMLATGEVKVYLNNGSAATPAVFTLPYNDGIDLIMPVFLKGGIIMRATDDFSTYIDSGVKFLQYRYVLIPGGTKAQNRAKIDWDNYSQVQAALGIVN